MARFFAALIVWMALAGAADAGEWLRAETPHFIVYSDGDDYSLRASATELEQYDGVLRFLHGMRADAPVARKLPIYLTGSHRNLEIIVPGLSPDVQGFYSASGDAIFAVAIRQRGNMHVLLHEYAHHFILNSSDAGYPAWFVEGYAEYFMTADISAHGVRVGDLNPNRAQWLTYGDWLPLRTLLTVRPYELRKPEERAIYYAQSWLFAHWFLSSSSERMPMLIDYVARVRQGQESVAAMEAATGMSSRDLSKALETYANRRLPVRGFSSSQFKAPEVTVTHLSPAESALLLIDLKLSRSAADETALAEARQATAPWLTDPYAQRLLARSEIRYGDRAAGQALLQARLEIAPDDADALRLLGESYILAARDATDGQADLVRQARRALARAYAANPNDYRTLMLLSELRRGASDYPTDNDMETLLAAYELAPQLGAIRFATAQTMALRGNYVGAIAILQPLVADAHSDSGAGAAQTLIDTYRGHLGASAEASSSDNPQPATATP